MFKLGGDGCVFPGKLLKMRGMLLKMRGVLLKMRGMLLKMRGMLLKSCGMLPLFSGGGSLVTDYFRIIVRLIALKYSGLRM